MKILKFILLGLLLALVMVTGLFYLKTKKLPTPQNIVNAVKSAMDSYNENVDTPQSDGKLLVFHAPKVKEVPEEVMPAIDRKTVYLCLDGSYYFPVTVPASVEIVTDYYKYIYARDNSFYVTVLSNIEHDMLSTGVGITKAVSLTPDLVRSKEGMKGPQEAAKHVMNDKTIVVRCYNNPEAFATVLDSMKNQTYKLMSDYRLDIVEYDKEDLSKPYTEILNSVPVGTGFHFSVDVGILDTDVQQFYAYDDGFLSVAREFKLWDEACERLNERAAVCTGRKMVETYYSDTGRMYFECGDCTVGLVRVNYNTVIALFGSGEEARFNIRSYLRTYKESV